MGLFVALVTEVARVVLASLLRVRASLFVFVLSL